MDQQLVIGMDQMRLECRQVNETSQRENWTGWACFVQVIIGERLEYRITPPEKATSAIGVHMAEGQAWASEHGYYLPRGWRGEDEGAVTAALGILS